jgi:hypothetical protein
MQEILTDVVMTIVIYWYYTVYSPLKVSRSLGGTYQSAYVHAVILLGLLSDPEYGDIFLRNVGWLSTDYMMLIPENNTLQEN